MPGPARAGILIYAKNLDRMSGFYERLLGMRRLVADLQHQVLESEDIQLVMHAIPQHIADTITLSNPPAPREDQAFKPFFTVESLAAAEGLAAQLGGQVFGPVWSGPGFSVRNAMDPEGNIVQLRERAP